MSSSFNALFNILSPFSYVTSVLILFGLQFSKHSVYSLTLHNCFLWMMHFVHSFNISLNFMKELFIKKIIQIYIEKFIQRNYSEHCKLVTWWTRGWAGEENLSRQRGWPPDVREEPRMWDWIWLVLTGVTLLAPCWSVPWELSWSLKLRDRTPHQLRPPSRPPYKQTLPPSPI